MWLFNNRSCKVYDYKKKKSDEAKSYFSCNHKAAYMLSKYFIYCPIAHKISCKSLSFSQLCFLTFTFVLYTISVLNCWMCICNKHTNSLAHIIHHWISFYLLVFFTYLVVYLLPFGWIVYSRTFYCSTLLLGLDWISH